MDSLLAARQCLANCLNKSRSLSKNSNTTPSLLQKLSSTFSSLSDELHYLHDRCHKLSAIKAHSEQAIAPTSAVLKVYEAVQALERTLAAADPSTDLFSYLSLTKRLEEALRLLTNNCQLALRWLDDVVVQLDEDRQEDAVYVLNIRRLLHVLKELNATEARSKLSGGSFSLAMEKLKIELSRVLNEKNSTTASDKRVHAIIERFKASGLIDRCVAVYVDARSTVVESSLRGLDLDYLGMEISATDSTQSIEDQIVQWGKDMDIAVKDVIQFEYDLCRRMLDGIGLDFSMKCFAQIVARSRFSVLLRFVLKVTEIKKGAIKLLKLLSVFAVLDRLRLDFYTLFSRKECSEIQAITRDIIKRLVDGAYEIFTELALQVEVERCNPPPTLDCGIPRLVTFVTDYCILLLADEYRPVLSQVLSIHHTWNHKQNYQEDNFLRSELSKILGAMEINLENWSKNFEDPTLGNLFLMNNYLFIYEKLRGTEFGDLMGGEHWLGELQRKMVHYAELYVKESWGKLVAILSDHELQSLGRTSAKELVKKRLKCFNETFDNLYRKQSKWVVSDSCIRETLCQLIVQTVVPAYRRFLHNNGYLVRSKGSNSPKYVKYSETSLEALIGSLYRSNPVRLSRSKSAHLIGRIRSTVASQFRATLIMI